MAHIEIERQHTLGREAAHARVRAMEPELSRYKIALRWQGENAQIEAPGVKGEARLDESSLRISLNLALMLRPLTGKLREAIEAKVDAALE